MKRPHLQVTVSTSGLRSCDSEEMIGSKIKQRKKKKQKKELKYTLKQELLEMRNGTFI